MGRKLRADQANLMAEIGKYPCPIVRPFRSLHADQALRQIGEEAGDRIAAQRLRRTTLPW